MGESSAEASSGEVLRITLRSYAFVLRIIEDLGLNLTFKNIHFGYGVKNRLEAESLGATSSHPGEMRVFWPRAMAVNMETSG